MKIEFNNDFVQNVKKQFSKDNLFEGRRKVRLKKRRINKNYLLLILMIILLSVSVSKNFKPSTVDESTAPVFSNADVSNDNSSNNKLSEKIPCEFELPVKKDSILSASYANGIVNLKTKKTENVLSMTDGYIENIYLDYSYGYSIVIKCSDEISCRYSNLDSNINLKIGDKVNKSDVIGKTLDYSLLDASYLYITVYYKNEAIDVTKYLDI